MLSQPIKSEQYKELLRQTRAELVETLLQPEETCYPWNPAQAEAEEYFIQLERDFSIESCHEEAEIASASQGLFEQLHQCWTLTSSATDTLYHFLEKQFSASVPKTCLEAIAEQARQVFSTNQSLADKLVQCVQPLLPNLAEDDLIVLARPWAYAMRDGGTQPTVAGINTATPARMWTELSPIGRARLSLAIAHSALTQLYGSETKQ